MDIQMSAGGGTKPMVVYIAGGGFMFTPKEIALDLRMFVAESGFFVASVQYRTVLGGAGFGDSVADVKFAMRFLRAQACVQSTRYVLKGAGHGDMAMTGDLHSGLPGSTNQGMGLIVDFLRRTLD
jgi:acetyl esterase/lipase